MGCRLVQAATLAAFIHIVFTSEVIAQDPTDLDKEDVPGRMLTTPKWNIAPRTGGSTSCCKPTTTFISWSSN